MVLLKNLNNKKNESQQIFAVKYKQSLISSTSL